MYLRSSDQYMHDQSTQTIVLRKLIQFKPSNQNYWDQPKETKIINIEETNNGNNADIIVNWTKTGRKTEGNCKYISIINSCFKLISIEIGLPNEYSQKTVSKDTILHTALHEFGHALGLGHGIEIDDLMFVPHKKTLNKISNNDLSVLKFLYSSPTGTRLNI